MDHCGYVRPQVHQMISVSDAKSPVETQTTAPLQGTRCVLLAPVVRILSVPPGFTGRRELEGWNDARGVD